MTPIVLTGQASVVVLEPQADAAPLWRWWGPRVGTAGLPPLRDTRPAASFSLDRDQPLTLVPGFGTGWFGPPALRAHRDGRAFAQDWDRVAVDADDRTVTVTLTDPRAAITLVQRLAIDPDSDVLTLSASVRNDGETPLAVEWLAAGTLPLPADSVTIRHFTGRHNAEFVAEAEPMPRQSWVRENRRGLTGHADRKSDV